MSSEYSYLFGKSQPEPKPSSSHNYLFEGKPERKTWVQPDEPPVSEQLKTSIPLAGQEAVSLLWSSPHLLGEMYSGLAKKAQERGQEQLREKGIEESEASKKFTDFIVNAPPEVTRYLNKHLPNIFPTYEQAKEWVGKQIEEVGREKLGIEGKIPEKPRGTIEKIAVGAGKALPITLSPGSALTKAAAIGTSAATEASDLGEIAKGTANITVPVLTSIIESIIRRRYTPPRGEAQRLYEAGRDLGMSDVQLAPIMATEGQVQRYGPLAQGSRRTREAFEETGEVLGTLLEDIQNRPGNFNALPPQAEQTLLTRLQNIADDIRNRTHSLSPREQTVLDFLDTAINNIHTNGSSARQIIGTYRSMNRIGAGRSEARRMAEPLLEAIESVDPALAADVRNTNGLYSRYVRNLQEINPSQFNAFLDAGELQKILTAVFSPGNAGLGEKILSVIGLKTLRNISSRMLTDPQAQSLVRNFGRAVRDNRGTAATSLAVQLKNYVQKNMPEEYEEVDWDKFINASHSKETKQK